MNLNGQIVFSYIEEDNTQKGFFRVRPLLCSNGLLTEDDIKEYPDDCYLRVVPDRNEQHTFKDRMRKILHFCLIDLKDNKPEYSKIRNNKNYAPQREENNRFIIYSDAVRALRNDFFYDIVSEEELSSSVTPHAFVRAGGKITGPFDRETKALCGDEIQIMPDNTDIFTVLTPDEKSRLIYMDRKSLEAAIAPQPEQSVSSAAANAENVNTEAPVAPSAASEGVREPAPEKESAPVVDAYAQICEMDQSLKVSTNLLKEEKPILSAPSQKEPSPAVQSGRLSGTPFYQAGIRQNNYGNNRNATIDAVERQRYQGRYEGSGVELKRNTRLQQVVNPIEQFHQSLLKAWEWEDSHSQIAEIIMEAPGMRAVINKAIGREDNLVTAAMRDQLQEMEAERLMHLVRLEKFQADKDSLFAEALNEHKDSLEKESAALEAKKKAISADIALLEKQWDKLLEERDSIIAEMDNDLSDVFHLASPKATAFSFDILVERVRTALTNSGFIVDNKIAASMLIAICTDNTIAVSSEAIQDATFAAECIANALGARRANSDLVCVSTAKGGNGFCFTIGTERSVFNCCHIYTVSGKNISSLPEDNVAVFKLKQDLTVIPHATQISEPACKAALTHAILEKESKLPEAAIEFLQKARQELKPALTAPLTIRICRFAAIAQNLLSGGIESALDLALGIYMLPAAISTGIKKELLETFAGATPYTAQCLNEL